MHDVKTKSTFVTLVQACKRVGGETILLDAIEVGALPIYVMTSDVFMRNCRRLALDSGRRGADAVTKMAKLTTSSSTYTADGSASKIELDGWFRLSASCASALLVTKLPVDLEIEVFDGDEFLGYFSSIWKNWVAYSEARVVVADLQSFASDDWDDDPRVSTSLYAIILALLDLAKLPEHKATSAVVTKLQAMGITSPTKGTVKTHITLALKRKKAR